MARVKRTGFRPSLAEVRRQNQAALDYYRSLSGKEDAPRVDVGAKPKREPPKTLKLEPQVPYERDVLSAVRAYLRLHPAVAWVRRINSGGAMDARGQFVRFHDIEGCSDLVGQLKTGQFLACEIKRPGQRPTDAQMQFLRLVADHGGCAGWADSVEAAEAMLERFNGGR